MLPITKASLETLTRSQTCLVWDFPIDSWNVQDLSITSIDSLSSPFLPTVIDTSNISDSDTDTFEISSLQDSSDNDDETITNQSAWTCHTCELVFEHHDAQRLHFQSELHRQTLVTELSLTNLNLNTNEDSTNENEASSSSTTFSIEQSKGFESTQQRSFRSTRPNSSPLLTFQFSNVPQLSFEMYYHILKLSKENKKISSHQLYSQLLSFRNTTYCVIYVLFFGGTFFMAAFESEKCIQHTSIKRYVTRRKQGGRQSTQDQKRHARSAGASLRRHNEQALFAEAVQALTSWTTTYFPRADVVFYFMPSHNKRLLPHVPSTSFTCSIPCSVRKPSFNEIHRLHRILYSVQIHPIQSSSPTPLPPTSLSVSPIPMPPNSPSIHTETKIMESQENSISIETPQKKKKKKPVSETSNDKNLNVLDFIPQEEQSLDSSLPIPPSSWFQETSEFSKVLEREKRALAAEKRLRQSLLSSAQKITSQPSSSSSSSVSSSHCTQCEKLIIQISVKRHGNIFCSIPCASQWRKENM